MVSLHLKGGEDGCHDETRQVTPSISQYYTRYHRRQIGQSHYLPEVTSSYDNKEIGRESPHDTAQCGQRLAEVEGSQEDIKTQEIDKEEPYILW